MLFEGVEEKSKEMQGSFTRTPILFTTAGNHVVRFINSNNLVVDSHFVKGKYTVRCLGEECPICSNNKKIIAQEPKNFRNIPGYSSRTTKYIYNVIDKTLVKVCPSCKTENKKIGSDFSAKCSSCDTFITEVKPTISNTVKLLVFGQDLATKLSGIEQTVLGTDQSPLGIDKYDVIIHVVGSGKDKKTTPVPNTTSNTPDIIVTQDMLLDPEKGIINLSATEINDLLRGVVLKDIFLARKPKADTQPQEVKQSEETVDNVDDIVRKLFND